MIKSLGIRFLNSIWGNSGQDQWSRSQKQLFKVEFQQITVSSCNSGRMDIGLCNRSASVKFVESTLFIYYSNQAGIVGKYCNCTITYTTTRWPRRLYLNTTAIKSILQVIILFKIITRPKPFSISSPERNNVIYTLKNQISLCFAWIIY